ncbi:ATP-binding protein, partial [Corynebacterium coyleae]|uniref:ATP-binding protein n=1 Tax=Corynebacterium coyleae TaxID=53374 RepID=UPI00356B633F
RKTLDGYDWSPVTLPTDITREHLTTLEFLNGCEDLVFYGDVGTGKTHLAIALATQTCLAGIPARFFTAAGLVDPNSATSPSTLTVHGYFSKPSPTPTNNAA